MKQTAIELTIRQRHETSSEGLGGVADLRFTPPDINISREMAVNIPVVFDTDRLLSMTQDPDRYGLYLADMLFSDDVLRREWEKTYAYTQALANTEDTVLRFRLRLDLPFQVLRWESLHNPLTKSPLCFSERILFSRYFDSSDLVPIHTPSRPELSMLVAVSSPSDLAQYNLSPLKKDAEYDKVRLSLGEVENKLLSRASLNNIVDGLRGGCNILYLECHGMTVRGETYLWLENDRDDSSERISGSNFVQRIQNLSRPPLLIVLASCQSGSFESETSGVSLGPLLAGAGVPAVLAMQGLVSIATIESFMPVFFRELTHSGRVDQALAIARSNVANERRWDWWMPVLFMRMWDGRLWYDPVELQKETGIIGTRSRSDRLKELRQLYLAELITEEEYATAKNRILEELL